MCRCSIATTHDSYVAGRLNSGVRPLSSSLQQAKLFFKNMPDELIEAWLVERVKSRGWPPLGPSWEALLRYYTPAQWQRFSWEKREIDLYALNYSAKVANIITGLAAACFQKAKNAYSNIENSGIRMRSIYDHLEQTGRLPGTVALIADAEWEIVDGSHRISCYAAFHNTPLLAGKIEPLQSAWVATLGNARASAKV